MRTLRAEGSCEFDQHFDHPPFDGLCHCAQQPPLNPSFRSGQVLGDEDRQSRIDFHGGAQVVCQHSLYRNIADCPCRFLVYQRQLGIGKFASDLAAF